jgi:hypothetical protein
MVERGALYSGRPGMHMLKESGWVGAGLMIDPCESQREQRKIYHQHLEGRKADKVADGSI